MGDAPDCGDHPDDDCDNNSIGSDEVKNVLILISWPTCKCMQSIYFAM